MGPNAGILLSGGPGESRDRTAGGCEVGRKGSGSYKKKAHQWFQVIIRDDTAWGLFVLEKKNGHQIWLGLAECLSLITASGVKFLCVFPSLVFPFGFQRFFFFALSPSCGICHWDRIRNYALRSTEVGNFKGGKFPILAKVGYG